MDGLIVATIMAGLIMMAMGFLKLGSIIKFIPYPITTGFTSGIAVVILASQIKDFFGLKIENNPAEFVEKVQAALEHANTASIMTTLIGILALAIMIFWPKVNRKIPGSLIALIVTTALAQFANLDIATIGSKFGEISSALPTIHIPSVSFSDIRLLIGPAVTIAILGSIESLLSAVVADGIIGSKHRSNMELIAQGIANVTVGLFGGIPATGAIARTVANIKNGGTTPVAGIVHSVVLLLILLLFMPLARMIPLASLAAVLVMVAYNMSSWREFVEIFKSPKSDVLVLMTTFTITVIFDLVLAIEVGMIMAAFLFMKRMSDVAEVNSVLLDMDEEENSDSERAEAADVAQRGNFKLPKGVMIYEINGPFFFGAADKFIDNIGDLDPATHSVLLKMSKVPAMDGTALHAFNSFKQMCRRRKTDLYIIGVNDQPRSVLEKGGVVDKIGKDHFFPTLEAALKFIETTKNMTA
jgi:SulP family sulfate permease